MNELLSKISWKTTLAGIGALLVLIGSCLKAAFDGDPTTVMPGEGEIIATVIVAVGLLFGRDNDKSSEDVGTK